MMRRFTSFGQLAVYMRSQAIPNYKRSMTKMLHQMGEEVAHKVQEMAGEQQPAHGRYHAWKPLAPSTVATKARKGQGKNGNPASPLYATGAFVQDVSFRVIATKGVVVIGSRKKYMAYNEYGTAKTPPRPIFGAAAEIVVPTYVAKIRAAAVTGLVGFRVSRL